MATIDMADNGTTGHQSRASNTRTPYTLTNRVDIAAAVTSKGSALAAADVIQALDVPAGTMILGAWARVEEATTGTATNVTVDLGITGEDVDQWADGFDLDGASAGDFTVAPATPANFLVGTAADTIDMLLVTMTGTLLTGIVDVTALVVDIAEVEAPGIATRD